MTVHGIAIFKTAIGECGVAWSERGIAGVQLPEDDARKTRARLMRRFPTATEAPPPSDVKRALDGITALLAGRASDLATVVLDMAGVPTFDRRVYDVTRTIAP